MGKARNLFVVRERYYMVRLLNRRRRKVSTPREVNRQVMYRSTSLRPSALLEMGDELMAAADEALASLAALHCTSAQEMVALRTVDESLASAELPSRCSRISAAEFSLSAVALPRANTLWNKQRRRSPSL